MSFLYPIHQSGSFRRCVGDSLHVGMLTAESNPNTIIPLFSIHNLYRLITVATTKKV